MGDNVSGDNEDIPYQFLSQFGDKVSAINLAVLSDPFHAQLLFMDLELDTF